MSYISKSPTLVQLPEVDTPSVEFHYNFFVTNEKIDDSGMIYPAALGGEPKQLDTVTGIKDKLLAQVQNLQNGDAISAAKSVPRFVHVSFIPLSTVANTQNMLTAGTSTWALGEDQKEVKIPDDLGQLPVMLESEITTLQYGTIGFQDSSIGHRLKSMLDLTINLRIAPEDRKGSVTDYAEYLDSITPLDVSGKKLLDAISALFNEDPVTKSQLNLVNEVKSMIPVGYLSAQSGEKLDAVISDKFIFSLLNSAVSTPFCPYTRETLGILKHEFDGVQERLTKGPHKIVDTDADYKPVIVLFEYEKRAINAPDDVTKVALLGYAVHKSEILTDGTRIESPPVYFNVSDESINPSMSNGLINVFDNKIKYGSIYSYSVSSIYAFKTIESYSNTSGVTGISLDGQYDCVWCVESRRSPETRINCDEYVAPEPPNDMSFDFDYVNKGLMIHWTMPTSSQNDTAKIQVFRRKSIWEPFTVINEQNFARSIPSIPWREIIIEKNRKRSPKDKNGVRIAPTRVTDYGFGRDSDFIYAVCTIDEHAYTSPYSDQFRVKFNKELNNIQVWRVSRMGAPKQYPNFFIESGYTQQQSLQSPLVGTDFANNSMPDANPTDAFKVTEEAMKDSGHMSMRVYFDPECLRLESSTIDPDDPKQDNYKPAPLLVDIMEGQGSYGMSIINLDRVKAQSVKFHIEDLIGEVKKGIHTTS